jgi:hypothetical protein
MVVEISELERARLVFAVKEKRAFRNAVRRGGLAYERTGDLPRIVHLPDLWLREPATNENAVEINQLILIRLRYALRAMIQARSRESWRYFRPRHLAVLQALAGEMRLGKEMASAHYTATAPPSGVEGSIEPVATPSSTDIPLGSA